MNHETKLPPHNDASLFSTPFSQEASKVQERSQSKIKTPTTRNWADVCDSAISSIPATKGWAIAAASVVPKSPRSPSLSKKKDSLNIVLSGDIPSGSLSFVKEVLVSRFNLAINPSFRGLERDFVCSDITNILFDEKSIVVRLCSNEVKNIIFENRKLLSNSLHPPSEEAVSSDHPPFTWKMFVSPHLDPQDIKNQKIVLKDFLSLQRMKMGLRVLKPTLKDSQLKSLPQKGKSFSIPLIASNLHNNSCYQRG